MRIEINCHHKGRTKMQSVERSASCLSDSLGASSNSRILSFAEQCNKGMKSSVIWHLECYTNTIKNSQHFFFDWLLKCFELSHTVSLMQKGFQWSRIWPLCFQKFLYCCELQESKEKSRLICVWQAAQSGLWSFRVTVASPASCTGEWAENWLNSTSASPGRWSGKGQSPLSLAPLPLPVPRCKLNWHRGCYNLLLV